MNRHAKSFVAISVLLLTLFAGVSSAFARDTHLLQGQVDGSGAPNGFQALRALDVDQTGGDLYAIDLSGAGDFSGAVHRFDSAGAYLNTIDGSGTPEGALSLGDPAGVAVNDSANTVYVTDTFHNLVDAFDPSGALVGAFAAAGQLDGSATPAGSFSSPCGVAVEPSTGDLYVGDQGNNRVWIFDSTGGYQGRLADSALNGPCGVAIDSTGAVYVQNVNDGKILKFKPDREFQGTVQSGGATAIALDPANDHLFVDRGNEVLELDAEGNQLLAFGQGEIGESRGLAVVPTGVLYVADGSTLHRYSEALAVANAETAAATEVGETSATLHGLVDPEGGPEADCHFEYGTEGTFAQSVPCTPVGPFAAAEEVSAKVTGLAADTVYQFRLVATNSNGNTVGTAQSFRTAAKPALSEVFATALSSEATLKATIDPEAAPTTYRFEYGTDTSYGTVVPVPDGQIAEPTSGTGDIFQGQDKITNVITDTGTFEVGQRIEGPGLARGTTITAVGPDGLSVSPMIPFGSGVYEGASISVVYPVEETIQGLNPRTIYHFRAVAENGTGVTQSPDRTFRTSNAPQQTLPDQCPNAQVRAQQGSSLLPECRAYEQVSPSDKNSVDVLGFLRMSADGEGVAWNSAGAYGDDAVGPGSQTESIYVAHRTNGAWRTLNMTAKLSGSVRPDLFSSAGTYSLDDDLASYAMMSAKSFDPGDQDGLIGTDVYRVGTDRQAVLQSHGVSGSILNQLVSARLLGSSPDGSSQFFRTSEHLDPAAPDGVESLYRNRDGVVELVSQDETGAPLADGAYLGAGITTAAVGSSNAGLLPDSAAVSPDGREFVYGPQPGQNGDLYLRRANGENTLISRSRRTGEVGIPAPHGASFAAASEDLDKIIFQSQDALTDEADPYSESSTNFYLYDVDNQTLVYVGPGGSAGIGGLVGISPDAGSVYFVARQAISPGSIEGEPNLYVWTRSGTRFISVVSEDDTQLAGGLLATTYTNATVSDSGGQLLFQSQGALTNDAPPAVPEVYLYDYRTDSTLCLSCRLAAGSPTGARLAVEGTRLINQPRALSADGSRAVFTTTQRLVADDVNAADDVYEWVGEGAGECQPESATFDPDRGGCIYLVSDGQTPSGSKHIGISPDGRNIYLDTRGRLAPSDVDGGLRDIYDVRIGGGQISPTESPCREDACQGETSSPPAGTQIGTATTPPQRVRPARPRCRPKLRGKKAHAKRHCRKSRQHRRGAK